MKRFAIIVLLLLLTIPTVAQLDTEDTVLDEDDVMLPPQWAVEDTFALVSVNRANLRSQPFLDEENVADIAFWGERYLIVGVYYPGESTVREPETDDFVFDDPNEREVWYLIAIGDSAAWIFGGLVIVANPETLDAFENRTLTEEQQAYIDSQVAFASSTISLRYTARLRSGPSTSFSQVGIIPFQSRVSIIGRNALSTWFYINYNGQQGWVNFSLFALPNGFDATTIPIVQ